jgi:hypothetical protein
MVLNQENVNKFLDKYIDFVNEISYKHKYEDNIRHLLYLIVPAFVAKYDVSNESLILKCFEDVHIFISGTENKVVTASFNRIINNCDNRYYTDKFIMLNEYRDASLTSLIDSIVHEYNHAINSINNEIIYDDKFVKVRTGLSYLIYDRKTLRFIEKSKESYLEEVINTEQTEEIINIINSFNSFKIDNMEFNNMLFALKNEIRVDKYTSNAYYFQSYICDELMKNKTFTPTISNLRIKGFVDSIPNLFDDVIGKEGSYKYLNSLLEEVYNLEIKYMKSGIFKKIILNKLRSKAFEVIDLINDYDNKCIYK